MNRAMRVPADRLAAALGARRFAWLCSASFVLLTIPRLALHELWRDEAWLWLVVRESTSLGELFAALGRSGQGYLFPLLVAAAASLTSSWRALQALNLVAVALGVHLFARWAPFSRGEKALLLLGYFPLYEYAVLSRHYGLGMTLLWLACATACATRRGVRGSTVGFGVALGLLCQTTVYGALLAVAVAAAWGAERLACGAALVPISRREAAWGAFAGLAGLVAGIVQLVPTAGTSFAPGWQLSWQAELAGRTARLSWRAFVPVPQPGLHFWNSNVLDVVASLQPWLGAVVLILAAWMLAPRRAAWVAGAVGATAILAFAYLKYVGVERHLGHLWLLFVAALWLGGGTAALGGWRRRVLTGLLVLHVVAGAYASAMDLVHPFSNGARAAFRLRSGSLDGLPLLAYREPPAASVALALGRPLWSPSRGLFTTHPDWGPEQRELSLEELRCAARELAARQRSDVGLVINRELPPWGELEAAGTVQGAIVASEDYSFYRLVRSRLTATARTASCAGEQ